MSEHMVPALTVGDASAELERLRRCRPNNDVPVRDWVSWLERHAEMWDVIVAAAPLFADNAQFVVDHHRRKIKELEERFQPDDCWPESSTW